MTLNLSMMIAGYLWVTSMGWMLIFICIESRMFYRDLIMRKYRGNALAFTIFRYFLPQLLAAPTRIIVQGKYAFSIAEFPEIHAAASSIVAQCSSKGFAPRKVENTVRDLAVKPLHRELQEDVDGILKQMKSPD